MFLHDFHDAHVSLVVLISEGLSLEGCFSIEQGSMSMMTRWQELLSHKIWRQSWPWPKTLDWTSFFVCIFVYVCAFVLLSRFQVLSCFDHCNIFQSRPVPEGFQRRVILCHGHVWWTGSDHAMQQVMKVMEIDTWKELLRYKHDEVQLFCNCSCSLQLKAQLVDTCVLILFSYCSTVR